jgi:hypothetical protein
MFRSGIRWWFSAAMTGLVIGATAWFLIKKWQAENPAQPEPAQQLASAPSTAESQEAISNESPKEEMVAAPDVAEPDIAESPEPQAVEPLEDVEGQPVPPKDQESAESIDTEPTQEANSQLSETIISPAATTHEEASDVQESAGRHNVETPKATDPKMTAEADITEAVSIWAKAWSAQDVDQYTSIYSADYKGDASSHAAWVKSRATRLKRPKWIRVDIGPLSFNHLDAAHVEVTFWQVYRASNYQDETQKSLQLRLDGDQWRITQEVSTNP